MIIKIGPFFSHFDHPPAVRTNPLAAWHAAVAVRIAAEAGLCRPGWLDGGFESLKIDKNGVFSEGNYAI